MNDHARFLQQLRDDGWTVERAKNGHYRCLHPSGVAVQVAASPHNHRTTLNARTRIRRALAQGVARWRSSAC